MVSHKRPGPQDEVIEPGSKRQKTSQVGSEQTPPTTEDMRNEGDSKVVNEHPWPETVETKIAALAETTPKFKDVLGQLKPGNIAPLATLIRQKTGSTPNSTPSPVNCKVDTKTLNGSFNMIFWIDFDDGLSWVLKIPANGHRKGFNNLASEGLQSEAFTMEYIRRHTTIPVPRVYHFDTSMDNEIGCPYILMECIHGKPLCGAWFDSSASSSRCEQVRAKALQTIAEAMVQLNELQTQEGGSYRLERNEGRVRLGGTKAVDLMSMQGNSRNKDVFVQKGPFDNPMKSLLHNLDRLGLEYRGSARAQGLHRCLRLFTEWAREHETGEELPFVLAHPDLDTQNLLVDEDGSLSGVIDWDGTAAVPHSVGCLAYPKWLSRDWNPASYNYDRVTEGRIWNNWRLEDGPKDLSKYRAMYAQFVEAALSKYNMDPRLVKITLLSPLTNTLQIADSDPMALQRTVRYIFDEIEHFVGDKPDIIEPAVLGSINNQEMETESRSSDEGSESDDEKVENGENAVPNTKASDVSSSILNQAAQVQEVACKKCVKEKLEATADAQKPQDSKNLPPELQASSVPQEVSSGDPICSKESRKVNVAKSLCRIGENAFRGAASLLHQKCKTKVKESRKARARKYIRSLVGQKLKEAAEILLNDGHNGVDAQASTKEDESMITFVASDMEHSENCPKYKAMNEPAAANEGERLSAGVDVEKANDKEVTSPAGDGMEEVAAHVDAEEVPALTANVVKDFDIPATATAENRAKIASWIFEKIVTIRKQAISRAAKFVALTTKVISFVFVIVETARKARKGAPAPPHMEDVPTKAVSGDGTEPESASAEGDQDQLGSSGPRHEITCHSEVDRQADRALRRTDSRTKPAQVPEGKPVPLNKPCPCGSSHKAKKCCYKAKWSQHEDGNGAESGLRENHSDVEFSIYKQDGDETDDRSDDNGTDKEVATNSMNSDNCSSDNSPASDGENVIESDATEFVYVDEGGFNMEDICVALGNKALDQERYNRLKEGYTRVLESLMGRR